MDATAIDSPEAPSSPFFAQAIEVVGARRLLFTSGLTPTVGEWVAPEGFDAQAQIAWRNLFAQLSAAGMTPSNLVKVTIYLADRGYRRASAEAFDAALEGRRIAVSTIVTGLIDEHWLIEIEAVAAD